MHAVCNFLSAVGKKVDILISGVGTGVTLTGVARYIKPKKTRFKAIAVEPTDSPVLSDGKPGRIRSRKLALSLCSACWIPS